MGYTAKFKIWRGDDGNGALQDYTVEVNEGEVVLDVLHRVQAEQANDLAIRWNCKAGKCGSCSAEVNGKLVSGGYQTSPRQGHLMLESEGGRMQFRKMKVLRLPADPRGLAPGDQAATLAADIRVKPLYDGSLEAWDHIDGWKAADWQLQAAQGKSAISRSLPAGKGSLRLDFKVPAEGATLPFQIVGLVDWPRDFPVAGGWHRAEIQFRPGREWELLVDGRSVAWGREPEGARLLGLAPGPGLSFSSLLWIEAKEAPATPR